jgi:hypothetical protein
MTSRGRIVEVCGDRVTRLYVIPCPYEQTARAEAQRGDEPNCSEAFFGVRQYGDALQAIGTDGLHRIDRSGAHSRSPLPEFHPYGPFAANFDSPEHVLVLTDVNQRLSAGGSVPLLVDR